MEADTREKAEVEQRSYSIGDLAAAFDITPRSIRFYEDEGLLSPERAGQSLTAEGLVEFLKDKLSPIEMPKLVEFRDAALPKTLIGKLSRKTVLEEEAAKAAAATQGARTGT